MASDDDLDLDRLEAADRPRRWWRPAKRVVKPLLIVIVAILLLYYPLGMLWVSKIDDDTSFQLSAADMPPGGSRAVAMTAALIDREVNRTGWVANDPFFLPGAMLDNMPNFQQGIIGALARFSFELTDQLGRNRGSSQADRDLQEAAGLLQYSGTKWVFDFSTSLAPTATSEAQYRKARRALLSYNRRLADGSATYERRSDNLQAALERISADLGSSSAILDQQIRQHSGDFIDFHGDDVFYSVKGQTYAYFMVLRELGQDFESVLRERDLGNAWKNMLDSFHEAATLRPWVVVNGRPDSIFRPSHLAVEGFYLLRARTQMREVTNILQK